MSPEQLKAKKIQEKEQELNDNLMYVLDELKIGVNYFTESTGMRPTPCLHYKITRENMAVYNKMKELGYNIEISSDGKTITVIL